MLCQARMEPGLYAELELGVEVCAEEPPGSSWETCGMAGQARFLKAGLLGLKVNTNLWSLRREGAV